MSVEEAFRKHQVVPDVISAAPTKLINVDYSGVKVSIWSIRSKFVDASW